MTSRISTLCSGRYMQVIKSLGHHLSGCWSRCTGGRYIEICLTVYLCNVDISTVNRFSRTFSKSMCNII